MSKLFKLKNWLNIAEMARHLSSVFTEQVSEADVLRLALDGRLKLSVHLVNPVKVTLGKLVEKDDLTYEEVLGANGQRYRSYISVQHVTDEGEIYVFDAEDPLYELRGLCDIRMDGSFRVEVERQYGILTGGPQPVGERDQSVLFETEDMRFCQFEMASDSPVPPVGADVAKELIDVWAATGLTSTEIFNLMKQRLEVMRRTSKYCSADRLPEDVVLVVRQEAVTAFIDSVNEPAVGVEKPLSNRERETLLTVIGVLCNEAKIDFTKHSKAAGLIQGAAAMMSLSIGETTIENQLKMIPDALRSRMK